MCFSETSKYMSKPLEIASLPICGIQMSHYSSVSLSVSPYIYIYICQRFPYFLLKAGLYSTGKAKSFSRSNPLNNFRMLHRVLFFLHKIHRKSSLSRVVTETYVSPAKFLVHQDYFVSFFLSNLVVFSEN